MRRLLSTYDGPLYQIRSESSIENTGSGGRTHDVPQTQDGYADATVVNAACAGTVCTVSLLFDQSGNGNHLPVAKAGLQAGGPNAGSDDFESIATKGGFSIDGQRKEKKEFTPVAPGSYSSAAIIMLTDGQRTTGVDPLEAAKLAAERGVRVYTVGIGTVDGETIGFEGWSMRVRLDEDALKAVANKTAAEYFYAGTAQDLKKVYETLSSKLTVEKKETEISALFALAAAALALLSAGLSLVWFNRIL